MSNFYQLKQEYSKALDEAFDSENQLDDQIVKGRLDTINDNAQTKAINIASYYQNMGLEVASMKEYERRMRERRQTLERRQASLKKYLLDGMQHFGYEKIKSPEFTISLRKTPESVIIDNIDELPIEYLTNVDVKADKIKIKKALKEGEFISGAHLEPGVTVSIK